MVYHKIGQVCTTETQLIALIRTVLTDANVGMVESNYTSAANDEILLKTKNAHNGDYGYLHFISKDGSPNYLELHAYPPGHEAFDAPDSFDAPDTAYLPGPDGNGGSYVVADEYYVDVTFETRIDYTLSCSVDIFSDGDMFVIYISGGTNKYLIGVLQRSRELGFGWFQFSQKGSASAAILNGTTIRKGSTFNFFVHLAKSTNWGGVNSAFSDTPDTSPSDWIIQAHMWNADANYKELYAVSNLFACIDSKSRGSEFIYGSETYYVIVPGSEASHDNGIAVVKGTALS